MNKNTADLPVIEIHPTTPWGFPDLKEFFQYKDLLFFMVWRGIKVSYAQSVGGYAWALVMPTLQILVFTLVFGGLLGLEGDGGTPYLLEATVAVVAWGYLSSTINGTSSTLVTNAGMLAKVYFPRLTFLFTPVLGNLVPFGISSILVVAVLIIYQVPINANIIFLPLFIIMMMLTPLAFGLWFSSLAIRYRDFNIAMGSFLRMLIYTVPVMYPSDKIPDIYREYYILNPFVGVIEGVKACLLGRPFSYDSLTASIIITVVLLLTGAIYFRRMERIIVDVV
ncbi:MAG: ABC transporter permease [Gammaproteobacteria bacterium]|nr:ABC transporter permease [Gammaproteobacteria bacterium]